ADGGRHQRDRGTLQGAFSADRVDLLRAGRARVSAIDPRLDRDAIRATAMRIAPHIRRTPVATVDGADFGLPSVRLVFKLEFLQHAGSFKSRGAFNHMLTRAIPEVGVVAASGGNHGAAVAH